MSKLFFLLILCSAFSLSVQAKTYRFIGQEYPPYHWLNDNGKVIGLVPEIVEKVCQKLAVTCSYEIVPVKRALLMIADVNAEGFMSLMQNKEREQIAYFGAVFAQANLSFLTLKGQGRHYKKIEDLAGTTIGVITNSATAAILNTYKKEKVSSIEIVEEVTVANLVSKLYKKRYGEKGLILVNEDVASYVAKSKNYPMFDRAFVAESKQFHIAFSKQTVDKKFAEKFATTLTKLKKDGAFKEIYKKYSVKMD